jgi:hypothetical protein
MVEAGWLWATLSSVKEGLLHEQHLADLGAVSVRQNDSVARFQEVDHIFEYCFHRLIGCCAGITAFGSGI